MKYIAYTYREGYRESTAHNTREEAAAELFASIPRLNSAETAVAVMQDGRWKTYGKDIQAVRRTWGPGR